MKHQYLQSSTSVIRFDAARTTADTGNLAALMADGMVYIGSVVHGAGITIARVASPPQHGRMNWPLQGTPVQFAEPFEPVATDEWDVVE